MHRMDKFPRPIVRRRIKTRVRIKARPNILARRLTRLRMRIRAHPNILARIRTRTSPRPHLRLVPVFRSAPE